MDVDEEVILLEEHVRRLAGSHGYTTFGTLFNDAQVEQLFESLVGTLKAAKKRGILHFKGHLLLMPTHADERISLGPSSTSDAAPAVKPTRIASETTKIVPKSTTSSRSATRTTPWKLSGMLLVKRTEFELERASFEEKIEWTAAECELYHRAKLDVEMEFFREASSSYSAPNESKSSLLSKSDEIEPARVQETVVSPRARKDSAATRTTRAKSTSTPRTTTPPPAVHQNDTQAKMVKTVKTVMNGVYQELKSRFDEGTRYSADDVCETTKQVIVKSTLALPEDDSTPTLKKIMNEVFKSLKAKFGSGSFQVAQILDGMRSTIVETTNNLVAAETPATEAAPATKSVSFAKSTASSVSSASSVQPSSIMRSASPTPASTTTSTWKSTASRAVDESVAKAVEPKTLKPVKKAAQESDDTAGSSLAVEKVRQQAAERIDTNPGARECDLTDPNTYVRMRNDSDPIAWMILGYKGSKTKLQVIATGDGDFDEFKDSIPDEPVFMYLNYKFGDTKRTKYIFMSYVPDFLNGIEKSRVVGHRAAVEKFIKYMQITWNVLTLDELQEKELNNKLLKAGGANYSVQESNKGDFSSYKTATRQFYEEKDKETQVKPIYHQGPLMTTPVDISGRPTVALATDAHANTSDFFKGKR